MNYSNTTARTQLYRYVAVALLAVLLLAACGLAPATDRRPTPLSPPVPGGTCSARASFLGFSDALDKTTFEGTNVGGLSALGSAGRKDAYYALVDNEGMTQARFYTVKVPVEKSGLKTPEVTDVTELRNEDGVAYNGLNFDGEGLARTKRGGLFISSETEPSIRRFTAAGDQVSELPVPEKFLVSPAGEATRNATFESLSLTKDGRYLFTANEGSLISDGETEDGEARLRLLRYDRTNDGYRPRREYFYLAESGQSLVEVIALSDDRLLTLERGFVSGEGNTVRVFEVSLKGTRDVSDESLAETDTRPVKKRLVVDLADCPPSGAESPGTQENPLLDNFEAMSLGEKRQNGGRELLLVSDDNFSDGQVTRVVALSLRLEVEERETRRRDETTQ